MNKLQPEGAATIVFVQKFQLLITHTADFILPTAHYFL